MKKLILSIFILTFFAFTSKAQFPNTTARLNPKTLDSVASAIRVALGYINNVWTDTTAANTNPFLKYYNGATIYTSTGGLKTWGRYNNTWVLQSGGGSGSNGWLLQGNLQSDPADFIGTINNAPLNFGSFNQKRFVLAGGGILESSAVVPLGVDTLTKELAWARNVLLIGDTLFQTQSPIHFYYDTITQHYTMFIDTASTTADGQLTATSFNVFNGSYSSGVVVNDSTLRLFKNNGSSSDFIIRGTGGGGSGSQTPWVSTIDGANYSLNNAKSILIGITGSGITENLAYYSEEPQNASYWFADDITVTGNQALDVTGAMTMAELNVTNAGSNVLRTEIAHTIGVTPGETLFLGMDVKQGTATTMRYSVYDWTHSLDIIAPTNYSIPAGTASRFTSSSFVVPVGCTEILIYPARDVAATGTYFVGRVQVAHVGNSYILTTTAQEPPAGSGGFLPAIETDSLTASIGFHGVPDATFQTTEYGSEQHLGDSIYMPNVPAVSNADSAYVKDPVTGNIAKQRVVSIKETSVQNGDILIYQDSCLCYINTPNTGAGMFSLTQFRVGITSNAPVDGDSTFYQGAWEGKWLEVYREGENQYYNDTLYGYQFDSASAILTVHPPFNASERVKIYVYNTTPVINSISPPPASWTDIFYNPNQDMSVTSHVWTSVTSNNWAQYGVADVTLAANGGYAMQRAASDAENCIIGFKTTSTNEDYTHYGAGVLINAGGGLFYIESGSPTSAGVTLSTGDWVRLDRVGSTIKLQTSPNKVTWTDIHTFTYSTSSTLYMCGDIYGSGGTHGKLYYPQFIVE